jgi:hypothetical protein
VKIILSDLKDLRVIKEIVAQLDLRELLGLRVIQGLVDLLGVKEFLVEVEQQDLLVL